MVAAADMNLHQAGAGRWRIAPVDSAGDGRVHALFQEVFGTAKPPAWWTWKYAQGRGLAMGGWRGQELLAHYAGFPRRVRWGKDMVPALQVGDVMVKAPERAVLTRRGVFQRCAAAFLERYLGYGRPYLLGFGFPNLRALRLAERLGLYARVDRMHEIRWPPLSGPVRQRCRVRRLDLDRDAAVVERLWRRMAADLGDFVVGVRDPDYLRHRYWRHPEHAYQMFVVESCVFRRAFGVIVLCREEHRCRWTDWVGPPAALPEAVIQARRLAGPDRPLYTWASPALAAQLAATGGVPAPLDVYVPACAWTEGPDPRTLAGRWWLTAGDTDFF